MTATLSRLADALAEAAAELEGGTVVDQAWARHLRVDLDGLRLLMLSDRHQQPAEVVR